jgi:hypothetical protein
MIDDIKTSQIERNSIENANNLDVKKTLLFGRRDLVMDFIAICVVIGFFGMSFLIALTSRDNTDNDILNMLIGQLSAGFIAVLSFFFGSIRKP